MRALPPPFIILCLLFFSSPTMYAQDLITEKNHLPKYARLTKTGFTSSWDGRLIFNPQHLGSQKYGWNVKTFRPEAVGSTGDIHQDMQNNHELFSASVLFDWSNDASNRPNGPGNGTGQLHLAVYPNPAFKQNPYTSNQNGQPSANGKYETYRIYVIGTYANILSANIPQNERVKVTGRTDVQIVVKNPRTTNAAIESARTLTQASLLKTGNRIIHGYEPTVSMDGRLIIWQGHPQNKLHGSFVIYSYNPNPHTDDSGWSSPRSISAMYYEHGPGAHSETILPNGAKFSQQYPIARKPISIFAAATREQEGTVRALKAHEPVPGAYAWLSWDASELFFPTVRTFKGPARSAYAVIGERTNWILEHVDGPVNWTRGNVTDRVDNFPSIHEEGAQLAAAYSTLSEQLFGSAGKHSSAYETILTTPLSLGLSMWRPSPDASTSVLPYFSGRDTYSMLTSHSARYFEVPLYRVPDSRFIVSFPFNEAIKFSINDAIEMETPSTNKNYWEVVRDVFSHSPKYTSDISGNGLIGTLSPGAEFPFEYNRAKDVWRNQQKLIDYTEGVKGNSIYFRPGAHVKTQLSAEAVASMAKPSGWAISYWFRSLVDLTDKNFSFLMLGNYTLTMGKWGTHLKLGLRDKDLNLLADINLIHASEILSGDKQWKHIAISYHQKTVSFYLNGQLRKQQVISENAAKGIELALENGENTKLIVGPHELPANQNTPAVIALDEFDLLNAALDERTLRRLSYTQSPPKTPPTNKLVALGKQLFFDTRLSGNQRLSCGSCHQPENGFSNGLQNAPGIYGRPGKRNVPTLIGKSNKIANMFDASAPSFETQWLLPLAHPNEMAVSIDLMKSRLQLDGNIVARIKTLTNETALVTGVGKALSAYIESLSPQVDISKMILSDLAEAGKKVFFGEGRCANCHNGPYLADGNLHHVGLPDTDAGRGEITGLASDTGKFTTPSLLALSDTAPYFHDGSANSLFDVINHYRIAANLSASTSTRIRLLELSNADVDNLVSFLTEVSDLTSAHESASDVSNHIVNYGIGCEQSDCFWIVVEGIIPRSTQVEIREAGTGVLLKTMNVSYKNKDGTTALTGRLSGSLLTQFKSSQQGLLFNIKYTNNQNQLVRSGPRFMVDNGTWPGNNFKPKINNAGVGCADHDCIWMIAENISDYTIIEISDASTNKVLDLYSTAANKLWGFKSANHNIDDGAITLRVDKRYWPAFATGGVNIRLINRHNENHPHYQSSSTHITSPNLVW